MKTLRNDADAFFNILQEAINFDPRVSDQSARQNIIDRITGQYQTSFNNLFQIVSYLSSRERDFSTIERQARAAAQAMTDEAEGLKTQLSNAETEAKNVLDQIRSVAAEQGVSQQAIYFKSEADDHDLKAKSWLKYTICTAIGLGVYALISIFFTKIPYISPANHYEALQLALSKFLIFAVIAYMLFLCSRAFTAHKHNAVVNRHRQNALLTFNALVNAAQGEDKRDVVLSHAASCIFSPQESGYIKAGKGNSSPFIEVLPKIVTGSGEG